MREFTKAILMVVLLPMVPGVAAAVFATSGSYTSQSVFEAFCLGYFWVFGVLALAYGMRAIWDITT